MNTAKSQDVLDASVTRGSSQSEQMEVSGRYRAECLDAQGNVKWVEDFDNIVTTEGKRFLLDTVFISGSAGTGTLSGGAVMHFRAAYIASVTTPAITNTYAVPGYTEPSSTLITARGIPAWSAAALVTGVDKATSAAFTTGAMGGSGLTATIYGIAIVVLNAATVGTLGTPSDVAQAGAKLYSVGNFTASKPVSSGDTLNVTYTTTLS